VNEMKPAVMELSSDTVYSRPWTDLELSGC